MDGFVINKTFYCKELGGLKAGKDEGDSHLFDIGTRWHDLTRKQQKHCMFLTRNMHKLPFRVSRGTNPIPLSNLNTIVKCFYDSVKLNNLSNIAYKGVQHLQIPSVNLEDFGCPKAEFLFHALVWLESVVTILERARTSTVRRSKLRRLKSGYANNKETFSHDSQLRERATKNGSFKNPKC